MEKINILICTIQSRKEKFNFIFNKLLNQINNLNLQEKIKIKYYLDNKEASVGFKRNSLVYRSYSEYICFIDDDDDVSENYIKNIYDASNSNLDCASLNGIITFNDKNEKKFIHSIKYNSYFQDEESYYRPPNHLNLIKKNIAENFKFKEINCGEDTDWAMKICRSNIIKSEFEIKDIIYYYKFSSTDTETQK